LISGRRIGQTDGPFGPRWSLASSGLSLQARQGNESTILLVADFNIAFTGGFQDCESKLKEREKAQRPK
jgi:hypothetical protein